MKYTTLQLLVVLLVSALLLVVQGCDDLMLNSKAINISVTLSTRLMDFPPGDVDFGMIGVKQGTVIPLLPSGDIRPDRLRNTTAKYDFFCVTGNLDELLKYYPTDSRNNAVGVCSDGMNSAGFSIAILWDTSNAGFQGLWDSNGPNFVLNALDVAAYALANFATVEEARAMYTPSNLQIILPGDAGTNAYLSSWFTAPVLPIHFILHDRSGATLVMEWPIYGTWNLTDNPYGTTSNQPQLPQHFEQFQELTANDYYPCNISGLPTNYADIYASPDQRFNRMALLNQFLLYIPWAANDTEGPAYSGDEEHLATVIATNMINNVWIPYVYNSNLNLTPNPHPSSTLWGIVRIHTTNQLLMRMAGGLIYNKFNFSAIARAQNQVSYLPLPTAIKSDPWYLDRNDMFDSLNAPSCSSSITLTPTPTPTPTICPCPTCPPNNGQGSSQDDDDATNINFYFADMLRGT